MNILVTGGAGYVGSFGVRRLLAAGHRVVVLDDLRAGHRDAVPADLLIEGDVGDSALVRRLLRERSIEAVMHFAGSAYVGESVEKPGLYYANNVVASHALLEAMVDAGVRRIVFSSTCAIYRAAETPLGEGDRLAPESPYASTKLAVERMIGDFGRAHGIGYVLLRYFNAAGAAEDAAHGEHHDPETHLIPIALQALLGRRPELDVYGDDYPTPDGTCIRDYVHVEDLAPAHELALQACPASGADPAGLTFNVGSGRGHSVLEVVQAVERVTGQEVPRRIAPRRAGDVPRLVAGSGKLERELGWKARHDLDSIVASAWAWHREHPHGYRD